MVRVDVVAVDVMTGGIDADTRVLVGMTRRGGRGPLIERRAQRGDRVVCVWIEGPQSGHHICGVTLEDHVQT